MYNKEIKIALALIILACSIFLFNSGEIGYGIVVLIIMGLVILSIFKDERIVKAFYHLRKNDMKAASTLNKIKHPEKLVRSQEAYYYYLNGLILSQTQMNQSERFFKKALSIGLRTDTDKAVAKLNLAGLAMSRRKKRGYNIDNRSKS